jgi:hypothetical protein
MLTLTQKNTDAWLEPFRIGVGSGLITSDFFDTGNHFIDCLLGRYFLIQDAVHGFGPNVLVIEYGELEVLGNLKRGSATHELVVYS